MQLISLLITASLVAIARGHTYGADPKDGDVCKSMTPGHGTENKVYCPYTIELKNDVTEYHPSQTYTGLIISY